MGSRLYRLQRQPKSSCWYADYKVWDGARGCWIRRFKSTGTEDRAEAERLAAALATAARRAHAGVLRGWSRAQAMECLNDILAAAGLPLVEPEPSWKDYAAKWLDVRRRSINPMSYRAHEVKLEAFTAFLGSEAEKPLGSIGGDVAQRFYENLLKTGRSPRTAAFYIASIGMVFRRAKDEGVCAVNPAALVVKKSAVLDALKVDAYSADEVRRILKAARQSLHGEEAETLVLLGICTGAREMDCARMAVEHLRQENGAWVLEFVPAKTRRHGTRVVVPVVEPLLGRLLKLKKRLKAGPFCPHLATLRHVSDVFAKIIEAAGVAGKVVVNPVTGRKRRAKNFHSLRHSLPSWLKSAGVDKETRMHLLGHMDAQTHARYTHHELEALTKAMTAALKGVRR